VARNRVGARLVVPFRDRARYKPPPPPPPPINYGADRYETASYVVRKYLLRCINQDFVSSV
jgi:hypothetical protein